MYKHRRIGEREFERLQFEWLHPSVAKYCQRRSLSYPALDEDGHIISPISGNERLGYEGLEHKLDDGSSKF